MYDQANSAAGLPDTPALQVPGAWGSVFQGAARAALEAVLPQYLMPRRWFGAKARTIRDIRIIEAVPILPDSVLMMIRVEYTAGDPDTYVLPTAFLAGASAREFCQKWPAAVIATLQAGRKS